MIGHSWITACDALWWWFFISFLHNENVSKHKVTKKIGPIIILYGADPLWHKGSTCLEERHTVVAEIVVHGSTDSSYWNHQKKTEVTTFLPLTCHSIAPIMDTELHGYVVKVDELLFWHKVRMDFYSLHTMMLATVTQMRAKQLRAWVFSGRQELSPSGGSSKTSTIHFFLTTRVHLSLGSWRLQNHLLLLWLSGIWIS